MLKRALLIATVLFSMPAVACDISANGLTTEQRQELVVLCEQKKAAALKGAPSSSDVVTQLEKIDTETISKIQAISDAIVDAVVGIAKGLNVEVNAFLNSPAGAIVTALLIFYLIGSKIWGIFILLLVALLIRVFLRRLKDPMINSVEVTEQQVPVLWGLYTRSVKTFKYDPRSSVQGRFETYEAATWVSAVVMILAIIVVAVNV